MFGQPHPPDSKWNCMALGWKIRGHCSLLRTEIFFWRKAILGEYGYFAGSRAMASLSSQQFLPAVLNVPMDWRSILRDLIRSGYMSAAPPKWFASRITTVT